MLCLSAVVISLLICGGFFLKIFFLFKRNFLLLLPTQFEKYV